MRRVTFPATRRVFRLEELELRLVPSGQGLTVSLDPKLDQLGDQIITVQSYTDSAHPSVQRNAFGIFDTGASTLPFSAADQARFALQGMPIPILVPGGAHGDGIGGILTGDVSQPGTILAGGLSTANVSIGPNGQPIFNPFFGPGSARTPGVQAFVGTPAGSPTLPTITGTPILNGGSLGYAALVKMQGYVLDFSSIAPGTSLALPDLTFVDPSLQLSAGPGLSGPVTIPLALVGGDNHTNPGLRITQSPTPVEPDVGLITGSTVLTNQTFLLDTGAQLTMISTRDALALGLDLTHPTTTITVNGAAGSVRIPGFTIDELDLPLLGGSILRFTTVPIFVMDVGAGVDGVLGMNLWNSADSLLYNPYSTSGPTLSATFRSGGDGSQGQGGDTGDLGSLFGQAPPEDDPFIGADGGAAGSQGTTTLPGMGFGSGGLSGEVFDDFNGNGIPDHGEPGLGGQTVYLDGNGNGILDFGEPTTVTDGNGMYEFIGLMPGTYNVTEIVPPNQTAVSPSSATKPVQVSPETTTTGVNFGNVILAPSPLGAYVYDLYGDILDRPPDPASFNGWVGQLQQGVPPPMIAQSIWESSEHRAIEITSFYHTFLHRDPDTMGLTHWLDAFRGGASEQDVESGIINSPEYQAAHPDDLSFLKDLYLTLLERQPDSAGLNGWQMALQNGATRAQIVQSFIQSREANLRVLDHLYQQILHRSVDPDGQAWLAYLQMHTQNTMNIIADGLLSSNEYLTIAGRRSQNGHNFGSV